MSSSFNLHPCISHIGRNKVDYHTGMPLVQRSVFQFGIICLCAQGLLAQTGGPPASAQPYAATPQRSSLTSDTLTTAPGTVEVEFGAVGTSSFGGFLALPASLKFTPDVQGGVLHRTEFSVSFDALNSVATPTGRETEFSQTLGFVVRRPVYVGKSFSVAVAPRSIFYRRGEKGARVGARLMAQHSAGRNGLVANFTWTTATSPSPTNPAQQYDVAFDYARLLGESGWRGRTTLIAGVQVQKPKHFESAVTFGQGFSYQIRPNYVLDFAVRQRGFGAGPRGYELHTGITANLGRIGRR